MFSDHNFRSQKNYTLNLTQDVRPITPGHLLLGGTSPQGETFAFTNYYMTHNGHPVIPAMGEFHFSRYPRQYWEEELRKMQAGGITIVASYVFWIHVEEEEGVFDWSGNNDLRTFAQTCQALHMPLFLRIGPFDHGECRNGGLPDWLYGRGIAVRSNDERYLSYVRRLYGEIGKQVEGLLFEDGGVIIGIQLENEYMHCGAPWEVPFKTGTEWVFSGADGEEHMLMLKHLANEAGLRAPLYSCTGWVGSPVPDGQFLPMQGGYAFTPWNPDPNYRQEPTREFLFRDRHIQPLPNGQASYDGSRYPYVCCELGGGIQITYYHRPIVPAESVQALAVVALGSGANWLGYYMYHGGSNPVGKHTYLNEYTVPRISYDFQAPIREFGQLNASFYRIRALHLFLQDFGEVLAPMMPVLPEGSNAIEPETTTTLRYAVRSRDRAGFLFLNNYQDHVDLPDHEGVRIRLDLPGESLVIPQHEAGLTVRQGVSAILPFNLVLAEGVLVKYATAQLLTRLQTDEQTTYVFFAPEGIMPEISLERTTYHSIEVSGGSLLQGGSRDYVTVGSDHSGLIKITSHTSASIHLLVLTQEQAFSCSKMQFWGEERLVLSEALVQSQKNSLHLSWRGQSEVNLAFYPLLTGELLPNLGTHKVECDGIFTHYRLIVPEHSITLAIDELSPNAHRIRLPATILQGVEDVYLSIDYLGDTGQVFLDGRLVNDHFANGLPWEIGLKRFLHPGEERDLILRISPLQRNTAAQSYFPTGMAFRPPADGAAVSKVNTVTALTAYHLVLTQAAE